MSENNKHKNADLRKMTQYTSSESTERRLSRLDWRPNTDRDADRSGREEEN
jgi:hypothetical protein